MSTIPETDSPWDVHLCAEACHALVYECSAYGYSDHRDESYRKLRNYVISGLREFPCFRGAVIDTGPLAQRTALDETALPPTLADVSSDPGWWNNMASPRIVAFLGDLLTALNAAGIPRPAPPDPAPAESTAGSDDPATMPEGAVRGPGRPPGSARMRDLEWYLDRAAAYFRDHGRVPTENEFIKFAPVDRTTLRRNLGADGLWPWEMFVKHAFPPPHAVTMRR